jgi:hypothetical protein
VLSANDLKMYGEAWLQLDPGATGHIDKALLPELLRALPEPMGFAGSVRARTRPSLPPLTAPLRRQREPLASSQARALG